MSLDTFHTALEQWIVDTWGATFDVTVGSVAHTVTIFHDNVSAVKPSDAPAVRFTISHSTSREGSQALTEATGGLIAQIFTDQHIGAALAKKIAATIEAAAKRSTFTTKGIFGSPVPQGAGSIEPEGLYQFNLRIPFWYLEAA